MSSVLLGASPSTGLAASAAGTAPPAAPPGYGSTPPDGAGRGNAVTVIAGVGVLLLAMGVGVLIGRSGASKPSAAPAQVISVTSPGAATTGAASTPTTTTPEASSTSRSGSSSSKKGTKKGASGGGSNISKPAPPSVLNGLHSTKGKSYEEKSKNLPNVVETG
ncbi:MAG TPA: hypothetical protein VNY27_02405 [Solirubrobacteraceae bacterium]|jgi:hypothetical protein|nr:hypothetical protein [Solirubrobacteraceae bacterium]